jgi:uncharacterized membrane protein YhfC
VRFNYLGVQARSPGLTNIDPLYFASPIVVLSFSVGLVIYFHLAKRLTRWTLLYSLVAYAGAIALKYAVQIPTIGAFEAATGSNPFALGVYFGLQTAVFEVGGAFLLASYAVSKRKFSTDDAAGFGVGLAFWENAVIFSIPLLLDYTVYYAMLSSPGTSIAQTLYPILAKDAPTLFYSPSAALPLIGYAILERITSLLGHLAWGLLCVVAAVTKRKSYLALAFPLGFAIDFLVPFSPYVGLGVFEFGIFAIGAAGLVAALAVTKRARAEGHGGPSAGPVPPPAEVEG